MGAMKDYALWLEENGYTAWDDLKEEYYYTSSEEPNELFNKYLEERKNNDSTSTK